MKNAVLVVLTNMIIIGCTYTQSETFEITPAFNENNNEHITAEIRYSHQSAALEFIGLSCYHFGHEEVVISYRLKRNDAWSPWLQFEKQHEYVESNRSAYRTEPIEESLTTIQFRTDKKLRAALTVRFFLATQSDKTQRIFKRSPNCDLPEVCQRECWCPTCPIDPTPAFTDPTHLIVHHSAGNNQSNNFEMVVEFIWDLHVNTNGWDDIGYNWLIDPNGILYEGRLDNYQGAHFSCINENTVGLCVIGDYSLEEPSGAAITSLVNVLAYEATEHAIDINEESYHVTGDFILDNLAGHRDSSGSENACSSTVCPGDSFYPLLADIRRQISELPCYNEVNNTDETSKTIDLKVFPNPFHHQLSIESDNNQIQTLELIDLQGRSIGFVTTGKTNDLSHVKAGVYFLVFEGQLKEKIIKL